LIDALLLDANYAEAITAIDRQLAQPSNSNAFATLKIKKADALIRLGKFEEAGSIITEIEQELKNRPNAEILQAQALTARGNLHLNQGRNDLALEALDQALSLYEKTNNSSTLEAAQALSYLGQAYMNAGKNTQAEAQLREALSLRQNKLPESHELIAASYNDLGLVYSFQSDNDKALSYYEKALKIYQNLHGNEHSKIAIANTNIGVIYRNLELYGDAINDFETALKIWEKIYPTPHPSKAFVLSNLAQTYSKMGDQKAALSFYDRALKIYEDSYGKKHPDVARVMNAIGNIKLSTNQFDEALNYYQRALMANVSDFESIDVNNNPKLKTYYNGNVLLYSLLFKAEALEARYYGKSLKFKDLTLALNSLYTCDTLIDKLRQQISNESDKISLGIIANEVYGDAVRIAYNAGLNTISKNQYFEIAFYFAEKSKSAVLLEAIADSEAKSFAGIPAAMLEDEKTLKSAIALCTQKLAQKPTPEEEKYLRETSFSLNRSYETFTKQLEKEYPEYFNLKFNPSSPSIKQLQALLDTKTAIISYFTDDKNDRIYIFIIRKTNFKIVDHALPKAFTKYITGLRNSLFFNDQQTFIKSSRPLFKLLIPKIPASVTEIVFLPTGRLNILPFETLLTDDVDPTVHYKDLPYLLKRFSIRYEFSAGLILQKSKVKDNNRSAPSIFLCAPIRFPDKDNLDDLPGTSSEVKEIANLFAGKNFNKILFTNQDANETLIKSGKLKEYGLLHFATHGIVDEKNPELSRIFLQSDSESEDGNLFAGEIYNLELNAKLVTLSACQTGLGKISKGEGVIGLSRALIYAGAQNVIVSFWSVADESTASLMKIFYQQLLDNPSEGYGENLRKAKLRLLQDDRTAAPYYWAPFILIGF
jgi:CHAT domain-containing protein/Tfp pilus assembly protein PilF